MSFKKYASEEFVSEASNVVEAQAKEYTNSQRLAYSEQPVLTFNGDITGRPSIEGVWYKISDTPVDLDVVVRVVVSIHPDAASASGLSETMVFNKGDLTVEKTDQEALLYGDGIPLVVSNQDGVYVIVETGENAGFVGIEVVTWVSLIEFAETIYPIDPKFLPQGGFGYDDSEVVLKDVVINCETYSEDRNSYKCTITDAVISNGTYQVVFDGTEYVINSHYDTNQNHYWLDHNESAGLDTNEPFFIEYFPSDQLFYVFASQGEHTISITLINIHQIDTKFIPVLNYATPDSVNLANEETLVLAKEYTDSQRIAYTESESQVILPETTYAMEWHEETSQGLAEVAADVCYSVVPGETYTVNWNGTEYRVEAYEYDFDGVGHAKGLAVEGVFEVASINLVEDAPIEGDYYTNIINNTGEHLGSVTISITQDIETIHKIDPKYLPEDGVGYIENINTQMLHYEFSANANANGYPYKVSSSTNISFLTVGQQYVVVYDDTKYSVTCFTSVAGQTAIGNDMMQEGVDTGEPFLIRVNETNGGFVGQFTTEGQHTLSIYQESTTIHTIDSKFLPEQYATVESVESGLAAVQAYAIPSPPAAAIGQIICVSAIDENGKPTAWEVVDASAHTHSSDDVVLTDASTGTQYKLVVTDGQLSVIDVQ